MTVKVSGQAPPPLIQGDADTWRDRWYDFSMTMVVTCPCKEGIFILSDGKATEPNPPRGVDPEVLEDSEKVFFFGECAVSSFGSYSPRNFGGHLEALERTHQFLSTNFCLKVLPGYFSSMYVAPLRELNESCGFIVAGYQNGVRAIRVLHSQFQFDPKRMPGDIAASDHNTGKHVTNALKELGDLSEVPLRTVSTVCVKETERTADEYPDKVNKNIKQWLVTEHSETPFPLDTQSS